MKKLIAERVNIVRGTYDAYKALANHDPCLIDDNTIYFIYDEGKTEGALYLGKIPYIKIGGGGDTDVTIAFNYETNTLGYYEQGIWYPVVAISKAGREGEAKYVHVIDADELFESHNVEDALAELYRKIQDNQQAILTLLDDKQDIIPDTEINITEKQPNNKVIIKSIVQQDGQIKVGAPTIELSTVASTGDFNDLSNKPAIPAPYNDNPIKNRLKAIEDQEAKWDAKYDKPAGGISKDDLTEGVQDSLNLADSALQSYTETDPTVPDWAKAAVKPSYTPEEVSAIPAAQKGTAGGVATLDSNGLIPSSQLPSYVDDVIEVNEFMDLPYPDGEGGKIYLVATEKLIYRWAGPHSGETPEEQRRNSYVQVGGGGAQLALGETHETAYYGDFGKEAYDHTFRKDNPHETKYEDLPDHPKINGVDLSGNVQSSTLKLETTDNKITSFASGATNTQYPSAKLVKDQLNTKQDKLNAEQLNAVNSGITKQRIDQIDVDLTTINGNIDALGDLIKEKQDKIDDTTVNIGTLVYDTEKQSNILKIKTQLDQKDGVINNDASMEVALGSAAFGDIIIDPIGTSGENQYALTTVKRVKDYVETASTLIHFKGIFPTLESITFTPVANDMVLIGETPYFYNGTKWVVMGGDTEGFVEKTFTIAGVDMQDNITKTELLNALNVKDGANKVEFVSYGSSDGPILGVIKIDNTPYSIFGPDDGTATVATKTGKAVTLKGGIRQNNGTIENDASANITLADVASTGKAEDITIVDAAGKITATNVEDALQEIVTGKEDAFTDGEASIYTISGDVITLKEKVEQDKGAIKNAGSTVTLAKAAKTGKAEDISIADTGSKITATNVEGALQELATGIASKQDTLTTAQLNAVNSGITSTLVTKLNDTATDVATIKADYLKAADKTTLTNEINLKQDKFTDGTATIYSIADNVITLKEKVNQTTGKIGNTGTDISFAKVAKTGKAEDITLTNAQSHFTSAKLEDAMEELYDSVATSGSVSITEDKTQASYESVYTIKQGGTTLSPTIKVPKGKVSNVAWDGANKKLTQTIDGTTSDVVTLDTLKTGLTGSIADGNASFVTGDMVYDALGLKADKATTYTKTEADTALALKADKSDTYTKSEVYKKDETYKKDEVYNKTEIDSKVSDLEDADDDLDERITAIEDDYLTSESTLKANKLDGTTAITNGVTATTQAATDNSDKVATTKYVTNAIAALGSVLSFKGVKATYLEILAVADPHEGDVYNCQADGIQYVFIDNGWSALGSTVDISNLVSKDEVVQTTGNSTSSIMSQAAVTAELGDKEDSDNKVTTISASSTDTQYPSAKAVYNKLNEKEDTTNKVTSLSATSTDTQYPSAKAVYTEVSKKEDADNKTTTITASSTDTQYPSAKAVYTEVNKKEDVDNKVTTLSASSTNDQYPSAKLVYDQLKLKEDVSNKVTTLTSASTDTQYPSAKVVYDELNKKMDKENPTGTGSLSINRKGGTTVGDKSAAIGNNTEASGANTLAEGDSTVASATAAHAEGISTVAASEAQHVQGKFNVPDSTGLYLDIVGNGANASNLSNAATIDKDGNAWYSGNVYVGSTSGTNRDAGSRKLTSVSYEATLTEGTEIGKITIDGAETTIYGPAGGGEGGTSNYSELSNKPQINSITLNGNKTASALGLEETNNKVTSLSSTSTDTQYPSAKVVYDKLTDKEDTDNKSTVINASSTDIQYPTSKAVYTELNKKEDADNKTTTISASSTDVQYPTAKAVYTKLEDKEDKANKVTSLSSASTDDQYPSAKAVYDALGDKQDKLTAGDNINITNNVISATGLEKVENKTTTISASSTDTQYPSAKAAYTSLNEKVNKSGDTMTGDLIVGDSSIGVNGNIEGKHIITNNAADLGVNATKIAVLDENGKICFRTIAEILGDITGYNDSSFGAYHVPIAGQTPEWSKLLITEGGTGCGPNSDLVKAPANAIVRKLSTYDGTPSTNALTAMPTNKGAFYATEANGAPVFGTLPIAQGGTGYTYSRSVVSLTKQNTTKFDNHVQTTRFYPYDDMITTDGWVRCVHGQSITNSYYYTLPDGKQLYGHRIFKIDDEKYYPSVLVPLSAYVWTDNAAIVVQAFVYTDGYIYIRPNTTINDPTTATEYKWIYFRGSWRTQFQ